MRKVTMTKFKNPETIALHAGYDWEKNQQARAVPIYATTSYVFRSTQEGSDLYALKKEGFLYSRLASPTVDVLEKRLAAYHGAAGAITLASGSAANSFLLMTIASPGQKIIASPYLYGGTSTLLEHTLKRWGIVTEFIDLNDGDNLRRALENQGDTKVACLFGEAVANPGGEIIDLEKVAQLAHEFKLPLIIDNTSTPPPLLNPFDYGADLLTYSLTKLIGGHGTHLGGAIVEKGDFNWGANPSFQSYLTGPDPTYGDLNFWTEFGEPHYKNGQSQVVCAKLRLDSMRNFGPTLSPFGAHEFLQGLETLPLRARTQATQAAKIAEHLAKHPQVAWVKYSGLSQSPHKALAQKYFSGQPGAVFGMGLVGGYEAAVRFIDRVQLWSHLANILDARSLVIHPASTTHQQLSAKEREACGLSDDFIRLSVGLENVDDLIEALDEALKP